MPVLPPLRSSNFAARIEYCLWAAGIVLGLFLLSTGMRVRSAEARSRQVHGPSSAGENSASVAAPARAGSAVRSGAVGSRHEKQDVIGRLEIPKISLSVAVLASYDPDSLLRGVGHIEGTAMPGGLGTLGLAGHRDTFFRPLRGVAPKMEIRITDKTGVYHYVVDTTEVVTPDQVEVLSIRDRPEMTLITCYPFDYIGAAPKRFIVHAHLISVAPDATVSGGN